MDHALIGARKKLLAARKTPELLPSTPTTTLEEKILSAPVNAAISTLKASDLLVTVQDIVNNFRSCNVNDLPALVAMLSKRTQFTDWEVTFFNRGMQCYYAIFALHKFVAPGIVFSLSENVKLTAHCFNYDIRRHMK